MKKGFTLVELLGVIIILALIFAIIVPNVLKMLNSSEKSTTLISAESYVNAANQAILNKNIEDNEEFEPEYCEIQENGDLLCDDILLEISATGKKPISGYIKFLNGKLVDVSLIFGDEQIVMDNNGELLSKQLKVCKLVDDADNSNTITLGDKYQCKVKDEMEQGFEDGYYFFVLGTNNDGTINLIMERNMYYQNNVVGKVATENFMQQCGWYYDADHSYGPTDAMRYLHNTTKDWDNIPNMIMNYEDENIDYETQKKGSTGYGSIITTDSITIITSKSGKETARIENLKARLPRYDEVYGKGKCTNTQGSCPLWLANYLVNSLYVTGEGLQNISHITGYWTLSSCDGDFTFGAYHVNSDGNISVATAAGFDGFGGVGVRPVITLPTDEL